jgi:hypothetical protein
MSDMSHNASHPGWLSAISDRVREREIRRQILSGCIRKAVAWGNYLGSYVKDRAPALLPEFLKMVAGSLLGRVPGACR